ncbi:MAG: hypothetical protein ACE5ID_12205, partial [Acidobacteriota bacterium]
LRPLLDARTVAVNDQLNAITIKDTPDVVAVAQKLVQGNDKAKAEVVVDVEVIEINRNTFQNLGIDITTSALTLNFQGGEDFGNGFRGLRLGQLNSLNQKSAYLLGPVPSVVLNFLKTDSDTRVVAKPQVRVTEGERAQLNIGQRIPIPTTSFNTSNTIGTGVVPLTSFTYQNVGISVEIEPRVHHNREVTLTVAVEVSSLAGSIQTAGGQSQPIIGTRNINTVIRLKEGESQILAGLIQENDSKSLRTVPGLDKIPILRRIFGTHENRRDRTDIILALTPHIVRLPDIRERDLEAMWVGTSSNLVFKGAERSPFGTGPFDAAEGAAALEGEGGGGEASGDISGISAGAADGAGGSAEEGGSEEGGSGGETGGETQQSGEEGNDQEPPVAVKLQMIPLNPNPGVGDMVDLVVRIFGARNVVSTPFQLRFDSSHLRYVPEGAAQGPFLAAGGNVSFLAGLDSQNPNVLKVGLSILGPGTRPTVRGFQDGVDGNGDLLRLRFQVLPGAAKAGTTSIIPFNNAVYGPGLNQLPTIFPPVTISIAGGGGANP